MMHALLTMTSVIVLLVCCCGRPHMCASACCRRGLSLLRKKECRSTTGTYCWSKVCEAYMSCHTMHDAAGRARGMWDLNVRLVPSPLAPEPHMASGSMLFACCKLGFCWTACICGNSHGWVQVRRLATLAMVSLPVAQHLCVVLLLCYAVLCCAVLCCAVLCQMQPLEGCRMRASWW